jgi:serine/threonine protein kinase
MNGDKSTMKPDAQREAALFQAAAQLTGSARAAFLDNAFRGDSASRQRLEALLAADEQSEGVLAEPAPAAGGTLKIDFADAPDENVGQKIGRYKILEKVGEGGCGVVYVAEQTEPVRRRVALKVIKLGMDTRQVVARFEAERQALAMMDHPNIAKVLDAGATENGRPFFIMELVRGIRITDYCDQHKLPTRARLDLFIQVCHAIQHAHQKGIIHRDIKPSNILVTLHDGVPVPKVIDFGIAKATEGRLTDATVYTQLNQFVGTPAYMSPEQAEMSGLDIDTRSDIYSLGVLLYELLTGKTPFDAKELMSQGIDAMRKTIREKEPERPSTKVATLPGEELSTTATRRGAEAPRLISLLRGDLDWIVMKCLEKDRTRRFETANGLATDLQRHLNNEPVSARPPSAAYKFQKALRRNKLAFTAATAVTAALVLGVIASTWQSVRAAHAKREAEAAEVRAIQAQANETKQRQVAEREATRAEEARKIADHETILARRSAANSDARYLLQQTLLPAALAKATEAFKLGGQWEDGLLIHDIAEAARRTWVLSARVPLSEPVNVACVARIEDKSCVVVSGAGGLRVVDARNGTTLGSAPFVGRVQSLFQGSSSNSVVAVSDSSVSVLSLPSLAVTATKSVPNTVSFATAKGNSLLLLLNSHDVDLLDLSSLSKVASYNWDDNPGTKKYQVPRHACVSADGQLVLLHGGSWVDPVIFWDRRSSPPTFTALDLHLQEFQFIDNNHFAIWELKGSGQTGDPDSISIYDARQTPVGVSSQSVPNDDIKGHLGFQVWSAKHWGYDTDFPIVGYIGPSGLGIKGVDITGERRGDFTISDRYANLLPTEENTPAFVAADLDQGVLALQTPGNLLIFQFGWLDWDGFIRDYCATACSNGLLYVDFHLNPAPRLMFLPFDPHEKPARFSLQWPADSKWIPWAMAATPDAATVAIIAAETDSGSTINAHYGRVRALIYHPGSLADAPAAWPVRNAFQVDAPTFNGFTPRFLAMDPATRAMLYWDSTTTVTRYDPANGKPLGKLELGLVSVCSRDGRRVGTVSPSGRIRVYDVSTGDTILDQQSKPATGLCLSPDGSRLVASQDGRINVYDVPSGHVLSSLPSPLLPLAYSPKANRFLGFAPDETGQGGSVVLADTNDASVAAVLNRAGTRFAPAFFSDSSDQIAFIGNRWKAQVIRSLRPEELPAVLNTGLPNTAEIQPLKPADISTAAPVAAAPESAGVLSADDIAALQSHFGDLVTVQGRVRNCRLVQTGSAANIYFEGAGSPVVQVWVPWNPYPKLEAIFGKNLDAVLDGHTIKATGRLSLYGGTIEVTLEDPAKLVLVP